MVAWEFLQMGAMMMSADQMANPLQDTDLTKAELLMREAIQNSVDERRADADEAVKFKVRRLLLLGDEKRSIVQKFQLAELRERARQFPRAHGWLEIQQTCLATLDDPDVPVPVLVLSDHNTNGLGGRWDRNDGPDSRFHNLVLSINISEKFDRVGGSLGSWGVGKMVYAVTSNIRTMAYYSTFQPTEASGGADARFMATAFFPAHKLDDGTRFTEGFSHFVTSMTAPIASGWSDSCRVGLAPTEERRLTTAHTLLRHCTFGSPIICIALL